MDLADTERSNNDEPLRRFLDEGSLGKALRLWFGDGLDSVTDIETLRSRISIEIAEIDRLVSEQLNAIVHHESFQRLEASWRGLEFLVGRQSRMADAGGGRAKVRVLDLSWAELSRDIDHALDFDQSHLFRKVYSNEFDMPGGEPFGLIIGDYEVHHRRSAGHPTDDLEVLKTVSQVGAAAFCPFVFGVAADFFGIDSFDRLTRLRNVSQLLEGNEYIRWQSLRSSDDARFVGLTLPRMLMRAPDHDGLGFEQGVDSFGFVERATRRDEYLWGNAAFAFAAVVVDAFIDCGWFAEIRGVQQNGEGRGRVSPPIDAFTTDYFERATRTNAATAVAPKCTTDVIVSDTLEKQLADLGFISLCSCYNTEFAAFYSTPSVQSGPSFREAAPDANSKLSSMLHYMLCVSRFAHYVKKQVQSKIGGSMNASELQDYLKRWLADYIAQSSHESAEIKAKFPLKDGDIEVRERPGSSGGYFCTMHLQPHYQLEMLMGQVTLTTEIMESD